MEVQSQLRYLRQSPRKVRLVIDLVRGLPVDQAIDQLSMMPKRAAQPVRKLIESAIANAVHNYHLPRQSLFIKSIVANEGPTLKRYRPRAFGRAATVLKRLSHLSIILADRTGPPSDQRKIADRTSRPGPALKTGAVKSGPAHPPPAAKTGARPTSPTAQASRQRAAQDPEVRRQGKS
ncbi:MAG: 50S ribosomal protein L22 [Candidatus Kerfeldbacteria bacterium]|nr:50S ribosomal protein L22 [Candidatus Kerfeldbacteria bacterium]